MTAMTHIAASNDTATQRLSELLRRLHDVQFAAAANGHHELYEQAHDFLDADEDTQFPAEGDLHFPAPDGALTTPAR